MTDRVYPSAKPTSTTTNGTATATTTPPPPKSQLYNPTRHPYRPQPRPHRRRSRRSCLCLCCFWSILLLILLLLVAAIAACLLYVLYNPRRPSFSVAAIRVSQLNLSTSAADDTTHLTSTLNLTITSKNPNKKKLTYTYDQISITALSNGVIIATGSFPSFASDPKNTTALRSTLSTVGELVDADSVSSLRSDLKRKNGIPLEIVMDTKVVVKLEKVKSKKLGIRVTCDGIRGFVPSKGKASSADSTSDAKCKVDLRIKIWKWTF
ncbi:hypothetical protein RHSIM_Rhsim11G0043800 [Rhododendron simsii]|uniref:Late embryogenesis abundant protein LEA-2 subgroup domain-containing protein n=1 Tax=Rhododendron simsii TaxID=118357 RepID=A0A834G664_RHOSS|nr:hypothetical protein RHSIM_Rhsim11G0043800 [Rhododendron simsii]